MSAFFIVMSLVGYMAGSDDGTFFDGVLCLWFYSTLAACLLGIVMPAIFSENKGAINFTTPVFASGPAINSTSCQLVSAYADSDYNSAEHDLYCPQSDYHTSATSGDSFDINPASGLPMVNSAIDVGGNPYGFGEPTFSSYDHHTSQFSDFDYHNNP